MIEKGDNTVGQDYSFYLSKIVNDGITASGQINDILFGLKEISGKLDTLIALKQVELSRSQPQPQPQCQKEQR